MKTSSNLPVVLLAVFILAHCHRAIMAVSAIASRPQQTSLSGASHSAAPLLSADGRHVVFLSNARNLVTNDNRSLHLNVYARDLAGGGTVLVSANTNGVGGGNDSASAPTVSSNGQFIAFESAASDLVPDDTNRVSDVFVRDLAGGTTTLVSVESAGLRSGNSASTAPLLSADGRWVIFESTASDLVPDDTNGVADVFARDLQSGVTLLVSQDATAGSTNGLAESASITADGGVVTFVKRSTNTAYSVNGVTSGAEIYVRDVPANATTWASSGVAAWFSSATNGFRCFMPAVSADGQSVVFLAREILAWDYTPTNALLFRYDRQADMLTLVSSNVSSTSHLQLSADGRFLAYQTHTDLLVWDAQENTNLTVCVCGPAGGPLEACRAPAMTPDGSRIAFFGTKDGQSAVYLYDRLSGCSQLISVNTNGSASASVGASLPSIGADGNLVAFESLAADFVAGDFNQSGDIYLRDVAAETTQLISQRVSSLPPLTGVRSMTLWANSVSADGRFVAFTSTDNGLVEQDINPWQDAFVRDVQEGATILGSIPEAGQEGRSNYVAFPVLSANGRSLAYVPGRPATVRTNIVWVDLWTGQRKSVLAFPEAPSYPPVLTSPTGFAPALSPDGRYLAFQSAFRIYVRDMFSEAGTNEFVSGYGSVSPAFSPDGRWVAFPSEAYGLVTNSVPSGRLQLYVRDLAARRTRLVTYNADGSGFTAPVTNAVFSADSRYVFFQSLVSNPVPGVYRHDLLANTTNLIACLGCKNPSPSADGRLVAVQTVRGPADAATVTNINDVFVLNLATGQSNLVSVNISGTGGGNASSSSPLLSHDGHYVVFTSKASDLVPNDNNNAVDVFVRDLWSGTTLLASLNNQGSGSGNALSGTACMAADGRTVFFESFASDLATGDYNQTRDIFRLRLAGSDSDRDGMDDDWEMAYFDTLSRDGSGDLDGDGTSDRQEFLAGTDPTDQGSVLQVITVQAMAGGECRLLWASVPGRKYRVEYKDDVDVGPWKNLPETVMAAGTTASVLDTTDSVTHRFYRVVLAQ